MVAWTEAGNVQLLPHVRDVAGFHRVESALKRQGISITYDAADTSLMRSLKDVGQSVVSMGCVGKIHAYCMASRVG